MKTIVPPQKARYISAPYSLLRGREATGRDAAVEQRRLDGVMGTLRLRFNYICYTLSAHISYCPITVAIASSKPSGGYLYFFNSFLTIRRIPARTVFFFAGLSFDFCGTHPQARASS